MSVWTREESDRLQRYQVLAYIYMCVNMPKAHRQNEVTASHTKTIQFVREGIWVEEIRPVS